MDQAIQAGNLVLSWWRQGKWFLRGVAAAAAALAALVLPTARFMGGMSAEVFAKSELSAWGIFVVFVALAVFRTWEDRPSKTVHMIADEAQSFWGQARQSDGHVWTTFNLHMQATNLSDHPILLTRLRLLKPRIRGGDNVPRYVATRNPQEETFSDNPIPSGETFAAHCLLVIDRPIGKINRDIALVAEISDERGTRHKVRFVKLLWVGDEQLASAIS